jgi:hypothetical protein
MKRTFLPLLAVSLLLFAGSLPSGPASYAGAANVAPLATPGPAATVGLWEWQAGGAFHDLHLAAPDRGRAVGEHGLNLRYDSPRPGPNLHYLAMPLVLAEDPLPTAVVFDHYPDGTPVTTDTILDGDEFLALGIRLAGAPESSYCEEATAAAILVPPHHIGGVDFTFLTSSQPDRLVCSAVPVEIRFVGAARKVMLIFAGSTDIHTMRVYEQSGSLLGEVYQSAVWGEGTFEVSYTSSSADIARLTFGRETSTTIVKELRYWR